MAKNVPSSWHSTSINREVTTTGFIFNQSLDHQDKRYILISMNSATNNTVSIKSLLNTVQVAKSVAAKDEVKSFYTMTGRGIVLDFSAGAFGKVG